MSTSAGGHRPLTKQRSPWVRRPGITLAGTTTAEVWERAVHDGALRALVSIDPANAQWPGWHLSVSHNSRGKAKRYPTWDELTHARYELLPGEVTVAMMLPPLDEYVSAHDTTFHLHEVPRPDASDLSTGGEGTP